LEELEKELEETLGDFDEEMQREQTYAEERANENTGEGNLGGIGTFEEYEGEESDGNASQGSKPGSASSSQSASASQGQQSDQSQESTGAGGESAKSPGQQREGEEGKPGEGEELEDEGELDIPSGNDDDIVARQIREAAENETDPELRKKLWEEYRKYKNQQ
jgi:hypothetical protein